ncbi:MAG: glycoside hydrolase, partial [Spirochaetaceae bacterium]|nr:glycoside hydrolase [Spirochaetaceae bacterium]
MKCADIQIRDPFLLRDKDKWYLFGSTDKDIWRGPGVGFDVYISAESDAKPPEEFAGPFPAFRPPPGFWSSANFWAPEVY